MRPALGADDAPRAPFTQGALIARREMVVFANDVLLQHLGYAAKDFAGASMRAILAPRDFLQWEQLFDAALKGIALTPVQGSLCLRAADGRELPVRVRARRLRPEATSAVVALVVTLNVQALVRDA